MSRFVPISAKRLAREGEEVKSKALAAGTMVGGLLIIDVDEWNRIISGAPAIAASAKRFILPTLEEQAAWLATVEPICKACPYTLGTAERAAGNKIEMAVRCDKCHKCGGRKTITPLDACPVGNFRKWAAVNGETNSI